MHCPVLGPVMPIHSKLDVSPESIASKSQLKFCHTKLFISHLFSNNGSFFNTVHDFTFIISFINPTHCCVLTKPNYLSMLVYKPKQHLKQQTSLTYLSNFEMTHLVIIIIMVFYCGLVVHITDTRAQKVVSYTSAHITETVFAHDQHWEEQSCLSSPQRYRHSQNTEKWINHTVGHYTTGVSTVRVQPWEEQGTFPALLTFYARCVHSVHIFLLHKSNTAETQTPKQFTDNYCIWSPYRSVE